MTEKRGAKSGLATVGAQDLEANGVEISAEEGARLVAGGGAEKSKKSFLCQFFRMGRFENAAAEESENELLVPREEFAKGVGRTFGKASMSCSSLTLASPGVSRPAGFA